MQNAKPVAMDMTVGRNAVISIACQIWTACGGVGARWGACALNRNSRSLRQCRKAVSPGLALQT